MAISRTYGRIELDKSSNRWSITEAEPHVCIKLKNTFPSIPKSAVPPFYLVNTGETCADLSWFMLRYPMVTTEKDHRILSLKKKEFETRINEIEKIFDADYTPRPVQLNEGFKARDYQLVASQAFALSKRMLLGDSIGLGKTLSAILTLLSGKTLPALVVVQTHLTKQWSDEIKKFTNLTTHVIKGTRPYSLPVVDVVIIKYGCLSGWVNYLEQAPLRSIVFDEIQELRRDQSLRYDAAKSISSKVEYCLGLSATPVYNYGEEIFNILNVIKPDCLGTKEEFLREWGGGFRGKNRLIKNPAALGTYLRERHLFLRRTMSDVGRELPIVNRIVHTVGFDEEIVLKSEELARQLSMKVISGTTFMERGQAARELDILVRHQTGVSKAKEVAAYVKILLENDEPVVLAGWHRDTYAIWANELQEYNPVFYTGSESEKEKQESKRKFVDGETNLFIISLRSGIGLDGLQHRCKMLVVGELDFSPQVHEQVIGRVNRDGQKHQVTVIFLVSDYGSDPLIIDLLGLKSSQSHGILNPLTQPDDTYSDDSRIQLLARQFLDKTRSDDIAA